MVKNKPWKTLGTYMTPRQWPYGMLTPVRNDACLIQFLTTASLFQLALNVGHYSSSTCHALHIHDDMVPVAVSHET